MTPHGFYGLEWYLFIILRPFQLIYWPTDLLVAEKKCGGDRVVAIAELILFLFCDHCCFGGFVFLHSDRIALHRDRDKRQKNDPSHPIKTGSRSHKISNKKMAVV